MNNGVALKIIKDRFPGVYAEGRNAFGDSASMPGRLSIVIPLKHNMDIVNRFCADQGITLRDVVVSSVYGYHRLIIDRGHRNNIS